MCVYVCMCVCVCVCVCVWCNLSGQGPKDLARGFSMYLSIQVIYPILAHPSHPNLFLFSLQVAIAVTFVLLVSSNIVLLNRQQHLEEVLEHQHGKMFENLEIKHILSGKKMVVVAAERCQRS